jgi:hypothetical protein
MAAGISAAAWLAAGTAIAGAGASVYAGNQAASASKRGTNAAIAEQQRQFDAAMALQRPYSVTGTAALNQLAQLYGLPYAQYQDPSAMGGGYGFNAGAVTSGKKELTSWQDPAGIGNNAFEPLGEDPAGLFGSQQPNFRWDANRGVVDVNGRAGGIAGGYINPQTG